MPANVQSCNLVDEISQYVVDLHYYDALCCLEKSCKAFGFNGTILEIPDCKDAIILEASSILFIEMATTGIPSDQEAGCHKLLGSLTADVLFSLADKCLVNSIKNTPNGRWEKYVNLAQLRDGVDAVQLYENALELLQTKLANGEDEILTQRLVAILCSLVEIYMTELCFESDAELKCVRYAQMAVDTCAESPEAWITLANVAMSQCKLTLVEESLLQAIQCLDAIGEASLLYPSYETRLVLVRLLLELSSVAATGGPDDSEKITGDLNGYYTACIRYCDILKEENDQDPQIYYLKGWALWCLGDGLYWNGSSFIENSQRPAVSLADFNFILDSKNLNSDELKLNRARFFVESCKEFSNCIYFCELNAVQLGAEETESYIESSNQVLGLIEQYMDFCQASSIQLTEDLDSEMFED